MMTHPAMRSHGIQNETKVNQIEQIHRVNPGLDKTVKYIIISRQCVHHPAPISPAGFDLCIVIPVPALVATELLVRPSVPDLMSALQTYRYLPYNLRILHTHIGFELQISTGITSFAIAGNSFFFFLKHIFIFFMIWLTLKFILA